MPCAMLLVPLYSKPVLISFIKHNRLLFFCTVYGFLSMFKLLLCDEYLENFIGRLNCVFDVNVMQTLWTFTDYFKRDRLALRIENHDR